RRLLRQVGGLLLGQAVLRLADAGLEPAERLGGARRALPLPTLRPGVADRAERLEARLLGLAPERNVPHEGMGGIGHGNLRPFLMEQEPGPEPFGNLDPFAGLMPGPPQTLQTFLGGTDR